MDNMVFSVVVFLLIALLLLCIVLIFRNLSGMRNPKLKIEQMPRCDKPDLLTAADRKLLLDLTKIGETHDLGVYPRVSAGRILRPVQGSENDKAWEKLLDGEYVDFLVCDRDSGKTKLVVMQGESMTGKRKERAEWIEKACGMADLPVLIVREYNLGGLEKALLQKAGIKAKGRIARETPPPEQPQQGSLSELERAAHVGA